MISQKELEKNSPKAAAKFIQLYDQGAKDVDQRRWNFWCGYNAADREAGHFSQDEINWFVECFLDNEKLSDNPESFKGIYADMKKGLRD